MINNDSSTEIKQEQEREEADEIKTEESLFAGKYKTTQELEQGYAEITKELEEFKNQKAPEEYNFDFSQTEELKDFEFNKDDELVQNLLPVFKDANLSQEQANKIVESYLKHTFNSAPSPEKEMEILGKEAKTIVSKLSSFAKNLSEEDQETLQSLTDTAKGTEFLYRFLVGSGEKPMPQEHKGNADAPSSFSEAMEKAMAFKTKYASEIDSDPGLQKKYEEMVLLANQLK